MLTFSILSTVGRMCAIPLACVILGACGSGTSSESISATNFDMKQQLATLEKKGLLPNLDRSTDIAGPDVDQNGIRDDLDAYIAALPIREQDKKAVRQVARVQQKSLLIDLKNKPALLALADASMASSACVSRTFEAGLPLDEKSKAAKNGNAIALKIEAITANTSVRAARYMAYMRALNGTTTRLPSRDQIVCEVE